MRDKPVSALLSKTSTHIKYLSKDPNWKAAKKIWLHGSWIIDSTFFPSVQVLSFRVPLVAEVTSLCGSFGVPPQKMIMFLSVVLHQ